MSELPNDPTQTTPPPAEMPPQPNGGNQGESDPSWLPARLQRAQEAERKKLLAELGIEDPKLAKQLIEEAQKRKESEMSELDKAQKRISDLEPKVKRLEEVEAALNATVQKRIDALPKDWRGAVPDFGDAAKTLAWLDTNATLFARPPAPNMDAGAQGDSKQLPQLTDLEREMARMANMSDADYAKYKRQQAKS